MRAKVTISIIAVSLWTIPGVLGAIAIPPNAGPLNGQQNEDINKHLVSPGNGAEKWPPGGLGIRLRDAGAAKTPVHAALRGAKRQSPRPTSPFFDTAMKGVMSDAKDLESRDEISAGQSHLEQRSPMLGWKTTEKNEPPPAKKKQDEESSGSKGAGGRGGSGEKPPEPPIRKHRFNPDSKKRMGQGTCDIITQQCRYQVRGASPGRCNCAPGQQCARPNDFCRAWVDAKTSKAFSECRCSAGGKPKWMGQ